MTLRDFLDVSYALLHEGHRDLNQTVAQATERLSQWTLPAKPKEAVPASNDQAMAALKTQMARVKGKPKLA